MVGLTEFDKVLAFRRCWCDGIADGFLRSYPLALHIEIAPHLQAPIQCHGLPTSRGREKNMALEHLNDRVGNES
jgi:hypothetical protein